MRQLSHLFKALSDETRLRILALLSAGELCVCDLMAVLQLPQSTVSRHLAYLRQAGLLDDRRQGVWMFYRLKDQVQNLERNAWEALLRQALRQTTAETDLANLHRYLGRKDASRCE